MLVHRHGSARPLRTAALALASVGALLSVPAAGVAAAAPAGHAKNPITHPELDYMGSTVAAHEGGGSKPATLTPNATQTPGHDVSHYQGTINWASSYSAGARFVWMKATEGTTYQDPSFSANYTGSYNAGYIRGAYHFATPDTSSGAAQAQYFVAHGGGWSKDGKTLPGTLDIEYNPYGATCYGLSQSAMVSWIQDFLNTYKSLTSRDAVIYTTTDWWTQCTGNNSSFGATNPLWVARYSSTVGTLPAGWGFQTVWQFADSGTFPGDQDNFNGAYDRVQALANG